MKKTSENWQKICTVHVLDPDGWDRKNYHYSWHEEKISRKEFERRMLYSTIANFVSANNCRWVDYPYRIFFYVRKFFRHRKYDILSFIESNELWLRLLPRFAIMILYIAGVLCGSLIFFNILGSLKW